MAEAGVDITSQRSKHVDELADVEFDYGVTVCDNAAESCPIFRGRAKVVHQPFDDPPRLAREAASDAESLGHDRRVRAEIHDYIMTLPEALAGIHHGE